MIFFRNQTALVSSNYSLSIQIFSELMYTEYREITEYMQHSKEVQPTPVHTQTEIRKRRWHFVTRAYERMGNECLYTHVPHSSLKA